MIVHFNHITNTCYVRVEPDRASEVADQLIAHDIPHEQLVLSCKDLLYKNIPLEYESVLTDLFL